MKTLCKFFLSVFLRIAHLFRKDVRQSESDRHVDVTYAHFSQRHRGKKGDNGNESK